MISTTSNPTQTATILRLPPPALRQNTHALTEAADILDRTSPADLAATKTALNKIADQTAALCKRKPHAQTIAESLDPIRARNLLNTAGACVKITTAAIGTLPQSHAAYDFLGCHAAAETWRVWQAHSPNPAPATAVIYDCFGVRIGRLSPDGRVWLINPNGRDQLAHTPKTGAAK